MIPAAFAYERPESIDAALRLLADFGEEAKLLAGGHSLLPLMKLRLAAPSVLIDVGRLRSLSYVRDDCDHVAIGALTRHHDLAANVLLRTEVPLLAHVAGGVGDPQVRHRGTIGGSIVHGDPASDLPAAALALDATFVILGSAGERRVAATDFFLGFLETAIEPTEMLVEIRVRKVPRAGWSFQKFNRRAQDWAIVGAAVLRGDETRVSLINMGSAPMRAPAVEEAIASGAPAAEAAALADADTEPPADLNASPAYRRHLARVLVRRGLEEADRGMEGTRSHE